MMCQSNRLCLLQMGKARHICMDILLHDLLQCFKKLLYQLIRLIDLIPHIQLHIQCHLIITASSCMKLLTGISDSVNEICLYKAVNIFIFRCNLKFSGSYICKNSIQTIFNLYFFLFCQDSLFCKHSDMCFASSDILLIEFPVKRN